MIGIKTITGGRFGNRILQYNVMCQVSKKLGVKNYCIPWEGHNWFKNLITNNAQNETPDKLLRWNNFLDGSYIDLVKNNNCAIDGTVIHNFFYGLTDTNPREFLQINDEFKPNFKDDEINVGIHFRGDDIISKNGNKGREIHTFNYYKKGLDVIIEDTNIDCIHLCTDDLNFFTYKQFKAYLEKEIDIPFKLGPATNSRLPHIHDFALLSECDYLLSSSSTYPVCAGFIGKENKKIIHSMEWMNKNLVGDAYVMWGNYTKDYPKSYWTGFDGFWIDLYNGGNAYYKAWKII
jgi:hypothetical protein